MMLLLDMGNTRIKAGRMAAGRVEALGSLPTSRLAEPGWLPDLGVEAGAIRRVAVASVAGERRDAALAEALSAARMPAPEFARVRRTACGVTCAYPEPQRLGVDRWVALLGARALTRRPVCVADAGSALTVDALDGEGRHLGGLISPGLPMMRAALLEGTGNLAEFYRNSRDVSGPLFAADTRPAIDRGVREAAAGLVDRALRSLAAHTGEPPDLIVTGGDGCQLLDDLSAVPEARRPGRYEPDLALAGLARLMLSDSGDALPG
jgi:type III pantothenate kinase